MMRTPGRRLRLAWWQWTILGVLVLGVIGALVPVESQEQTAETPLNVRDCLDVSEDVVRSLLSGVPGGQLENYWAVRSTAHQNAYYLAGMLTIPGELESTPALWVTNNLQQPSSILAVNGIAVQFSQWGNGTRTAAEFSPAAPDARKALRCVGE